MKRINKILFFLTVFVCFTPQPALAQQECMFGEVKWFAGNFAPRNWAFAHGQLLPISQNTALFSILGTMYGGDGRTTFGLPDLRERTLVGTGNGPGLVTRQEGEKFGTETNTLTIAQLPAHSHSLTADAGNAVTATPTDNLLAKSGSYRTESVHKNDTTLSSRSIGTTGGGQSVNNIQPSLGMNPIICLFGTFPSRN